MFKGNRPIGQRLIQMPFRRRIARRAPVLDAQQGKRRFTVFPNAAALPVNPFQHSACNVQRVRPIRLLRQVVCRQFRAAEQFTNALFILPFQRVFHLPKRFAKLHQPLRQSFSPFLHNADENTAGSPAPCRQFQRKTRALRLSAAEYPAQSVQTESTLSAASSFQLLLRSCWRMSTRCRPRRECRADTAGRTRTAFGPSMACTEQRPSGRCSGQSPVHVGAICA